MESSTGSDERDVRNGGPAKERGGAREGPAGLDREGERATEEGRERHRGIEM
jgi:hypothetical protein